MSGGTSVQTMPMLSQTTAEAQTPTQNENTSTPMIVATTDRAPTNDCSVILQQCNTTAPPLVEEAKDNAKKDDVDTAKEPASNGTTQGKLISMKYIST